MYISTTGCSYTTTVFTVDKKSCHQDPKNLFPVNRQVAGNMSVSLMQAMYHTVPHHMSWHHAMQRISPDGFKLITALYSSHLNYTVPHAHFSCAALEVVQRRFRISQSMIFTGLKATIPHDCKPSWLE